MSLVTYKDLVDHVTLYLGNGVNDTTQQAARIAVQQAYSAVEKCRKWSCYYQVGRIVTVPNYDTGTIAYDVTGGAYEQLVTLSSGTWPAWAASGSILIDDIPYQVDERKSSTELTLVEGPADDIAAGETYNLYQDTFTLPDDFQKMDRPITHQGMRLEEVHPQEWLGMQSATKNLGQPTRYIITSDPKNRALMAVRLDPAPSIAYVLDYWYIRRGRPLRIEAYTQGLVTVAGTAATGSGVVWNSAMVGAVLRLAPDAENTPTDVSGTNPFVGEALIKSVDTSSTITLASSPGNQTGVKYTISDPVDIEAGAMLTYLLRECELQMRNIKSMKSTPEQRDAYMQARNEAESADGRDYSRKSAGASPARRRWPDGQINFVNQGNW